MSHTKASGSDKADFYNRFFEFARVTTEVVVTDEGVYQKDQVPTTYGGAQLGLSVVWAVFMVNAKAELQVWEFQMEYPMDKDKKKGGPLVRDGVEVKAKTGASATPVVQTTVFNTYLDEQRKTLGKAAYQQFKGDLALQPGQPKS